MTDEIIGQSQYPASDIAALFLLADGRALIVATSPTSSFF
jgi:hypothetical protein